MSITKEHHEFLNSFGFNQEACNFFDTIFGKAPFEDNGSFTFSPRHTEEIVAKILKMCSQCPQELFSKLYFLLEKRVRFFEERMRTDVIDFFSQERLDIIESIIHYPVLGDDSLDIIYFDKLTRYVRLFYITNF